MIQYLFSKQHSFIWVITSLFFILSCEDKITQDFGSLSINLTPSQSQEVSDNDRSANNIVDYTSARITVNGIAETINLTSSTSASYRKEAIPVGPVSVTVDLMNGTAVRYSQTRSGTINKNQTTSISFNNFTVTNQVINVSTPITGDFDLGDTISFSWTNTHADKPVHIERMDYVNGQYVKTAIIESNYTGTSYTWNTDGQQDGDNLKIRIASTISNATALSAGSFNLVQANLDNVQYSNNTWGSASDMVIVSWDKLRLDWNYSHDSSSRYDIAMCNSSGNDCVDFETNVAATGSTSTGAYFSNLQVDISSYISDEYPYEDARWQVCVSGTDNCGLSPTFDNYYKLIYPYSSGSVPSVSSGESIYMGLLGNTVTNLNINMYGGSGDADLYLYSVSNPWSSSVSVSQVDSSGSASNSENVSASNRSYYILEVYGYTSASGYGFTVSYNNKDGERVVQNFNSEDLGFSNQNDNPSFQKLNFDSELFKKEVIIK